MGLYYTFTFRNHSCLRPGATTSSCLCALTQYHLKSYVSCYLQLHPLSRLDSPLHGGDGEVWGEGGAVYLEPSLSGPSVGDREGLRDNLVLCYEVTKVDSVWRGLKVGGGWEAEGWREEGRERRRHMTKEG